MRCLAEYAIELRNVTKSFGKTVAVKDFSLTVNKGELVSLLGPSGCGKTTTLRIIAGFYEPDEGDVYIGSKLVNGIPPFKRNTAMVFQDYALFPHMNVFENVAYGLKVRGLPKQEISKKVKEALELVNLKGYERRSPVQLSGGEQQRVALARSLVVEPEVLLLDEPLSNLDAKLRVGMRKEIKDIQRKLKITVIYVTHDQEEALSISDRVVVMNKGVKVQEGNPQEIYFKPKNRFVAEFLGMRNFIEGKVVKSLEDRLIVEIGDGIELTLEPEVGLREGENVTVTCRSEAVRLTKDRPYDHENVIEGEVETVLFLGANVQYFVKAGKVTWIVALSNPKPYDVLEGKVYMHLDKSMLHVIKD